MHCTCYKTDPTPSGWLKQRAQALLQQTGCGSNLKLAVNLEVWGTIETLTIQCLKDSKTETFFVFKQNRQNHLYETYVMS